MSDPGRYLQSLRKLRDYAAKGCWEAQVRLTFPRKTIFIWSFLCCHCKPRLLSLEARSKLLNSICTCVRVFTLQVPLFWKILHVCGTIQVRTHLLMDLKAYPQIMCASNI